MLSTSMRQRTTNFLKLHQMPPNRLGPRLLSWHHHKENLVPLTWHRRQWRKRWLRRGCLPSRQSLHHPKDVNRLWLSQGSSVSRTRLLFTNDDWGLQQHHLLDLHLSPSILFLLQRRLGVRPLLAMRTNTNEGVTTHTSTRYHATTGGPKLLSIAVSWRKHRNIAKFMRSCLGASHWVMLSSKLLGTTLQPNWFHSWTKRTKHDALLKRPPTLIPDVTRTTRLPFDEDYKTALWRGLQDCP